MSTTQNKELLLIVAVTPSFLEKEPLWFAENLEKIKKLSGTEAWWRNNVSILEKDQAINISELLRKVVELGYEKTSIAGAPGEFSQRGGFITIWPVNEKGPWQIEYLGNKIERISASPVSVPEKIPKPKASLHDLENLKPGDYVVHIDHGIGIFRGFSFSSESKVEQNKSGVGNEGWYFVIEYALAKTGHAPDRLLVPKDQASRLSPYLGLETPAIHRLGTELWIRTKRKAKEEIEKLARELLALYASREIASRPPYLHQAEIEKEIAAGFPHIETDDQLEAMADIEKDLESSRPMDRLLIGDVGFGKTEVALRAACRVALNGRQVAVLAPTTILAHQHFKTFSERLKNFPIEIGSISRLLGKNEEKEVLEKIATGKIDIIIGTHRLLSKDVNFRDLGLLIIDEEQRFGVKQKEKLKSLRTSLDILSLSATPIPRTMSLALSSLRSLSILQTPPPSRLPITTFVLPYSKKLVSEAIEKELGRNGQVYFLHNRVETIEMRRAELEKLIPHGKFAVIHGRMDEKKLIDTMDRFRDGEINILVATTIIENGLDLSNVNTLVVADASRLGLAQAHQLRGRIGRGEAESFAYFLYQSHRLKDKARDRLEVLREESELGAGYKISLRDLELRGAGNILGREQSGTINAVGLNLYMHMLSEAIEQARHPN